MRDAARAHIGDTGLLDHALKWLEGAVVGGSGGGVGGVAHSLRSHRSNQASGAEAMGRLKVSQRRRYIRRV